jgi:hypothetical protein
VFARGVRNSFDPAFAPNGELFTGENSGDRDDTEELNWLREGHHYGFPWRMGLADNPQQFPGYDPEADLLIDHDYTAYQRGFFHDDPGFPPPPPGVVFTDPVLNEGPDADSFRDPATGAIRDASDEGILLGTFTAHRSPLGLVFDAEEAMSPEFRGDGFILSWTRGDPTGDSRGGPFRDPSQDLLHLKLTREGDGYRARVTRLVSGFNQPIDAAISGNRIYVLEHGGSGVIWEVTLPASSPPPRFSRGRVNGDDQLDLADPVAVLLHLFLSRPVPCVDAADADDSGAVEVADAVHLLLHLFSQGPPPAPPHPACGSDPAPEDLGGDLGCESSPACP